MYTSAIIIVPALSDRVISIEERAMACCVRGYHVYTLYSNGEYGHQILRDVNPSDLIAYDIAADGMVVESDPFGSGRPSIGFKYRQIDMRPAIAFQDLESHENCMHCIE